MFFNNVTTLKTTEIASDPKHWGIKYKQLEIIKEIIDIKETQKPIKIINYIAGKLLLYSIIMWPIIYKRDVKLSVKEALLGKNYQMHSRMLHNILIT